jgi:hypothetical protein
MEDNFRGGDMINIIPIVCTSCGKKTSSFYCKNGEWWDKYVKPTEQLCLDCIKDIPGFADEFKKLIGISVWEYQKTVK